MSFPFSSRPPGTNRDHFAFLRLLLGCVGDDDAAYRFLFAFETLDHDAVMQGTEYHVVSFQF